MQTSILTYLIIGFGLVNLFRMAMFLIGSDIYALKAHLKNKKKIKYTPRISVVIPAHNEGQTVLTSIESVYKSNYPKSRLEIIIVDDGSKDDTPNIVKKFIKNHKDVSIRLIRQKNSGKARALNNAMKNYATGTLVMCLDADSALDVNALRNASRHFADKKVAAMSANVKIIKRPGILNFIQRYEYLICYQMKRAENLFDFEYIVGGIGSMFRRKVLKKVNYYDTNTVTEDIDLTMKILKLGNKDYKVIYGDNVVAHTESVFSVKDLIKQRERWKWGRCQTFMKNLEMFFSNDKKYTKSLTWFYLPFAIYGDIAYLFEPILLAYVLFVSIYFKDPLTIISAWIVITTYVILNIISEDTYSILERAKLSLFAPLMYFLFYILSFVEYVALIKSLFRINTLKESLNDDKCGWTHVARAPLLPSQTYPVLEISGNS
jgi:poly-beta-1,6-N-acetyl-D-glucosamine synthase